MYDVPKFHDIQLELLAKAAAVYLAAPEPVARDLNDVMTRAATIIVECRKALQEIKQLGITDGHLSATSMRADEALMLIQENTK